MYTLISIAVLEEVDPIFKFCFRGALRFFALKREVTSTCYQMPDLGFSSHHICFQIDLIDILRV